MKTYILRDPHTVEPKEPTSDPLRADPAAVALTRQILGPPPVPTKASPLTRLLLFVGLDVHNDSIAVAIAPSDSAEVRSYGIIGGQHADVLQLAKRLLKAHPGAWLQFCYEAGPHGFPLCRCLRDAGFECIIVAPSKVPRKPGERVKTDRRDALQLARLYRAGELTAIYVPDPEDEAIRDLIRGRYQVGKARHRARQQLKMFLLRHNRRYGGKTPWTPAHQRYLARVQMPFAAQQIVFQEMVNVISEATTRLEHFEQEIQRAVPGWRWEPAVQALMSLRGFNLLHAATLVAELGDFNRFAHPSQLMSYLGLVPSEHTSGPDRQQGGITKMGNGPARRALIEAAWQYRAPAALSPPLKKRQEGLPKTITDISWNAQRRLHYRYRHLTRTGKKKAQVAVTAVARELSGFAWAIARQVQPRATGARSASRRRPAPTSLADVSLQGCSPKAPVAPVSTAH
jgi:transposase